MSEENVELVRRSIEAYVAGDVDAYIRKFFAEDVEVFPDVSLPEAKPFRGREQFRRFVAEVAEGWEGATADIQEIFRGRAGHCSGRLGERANQRIDLRPT
jgi:ketosteroid isomerase-like protein